VVSGQAAGAVLPGRPWRVGRKCLNFAGKEMLTAFGPRPTNLARPLAFCSAFTPVALALRTAKALVCLAAVSAGCPRFCAGPGMRR